MISLTLSERTEKLRTDFEQWLKQTPPPQLAGKVELEKFVEVSRAWQARLAADRWVGVHWPEQYGGRGLNISDEAVIQECLARYRSPQLINLFGLTMVGPVLIRHGTDEQRARFLPKILSAEEIWCQGFSEPGAGSDLAAVRTEAKRVKTGKTEHWEISGQKVWTSFAQIASWCFILARSDCASKRHEGLSYFLMPMGNNGITVRPLTQISGDKEFNELFLERVQVPVENIVGKEGEGWKIAISTLMYERVILTFARHLQSEGALDDIALLIKKIRNEGKEPPAALVEKMGELIAISMGVRSLALSHLLRYDAGVAPGPEGSLDKLGWSETFQRICQLGMELLGQNALITNGPNSYQNGLFQHQYLYSRGRTIAAGTSEIQRSIIAERVLGLPRG